MPWLSPLGPQPDSHSPAPACGLSLGIRAVLMQVCRWRNYSTVPCSSDQPTKTAGSWCIHTPALSPVGQENCEVKFCTVTHSPSKTEIQVSTVVSSLITPSTGSFCLSYFLCFVGLLPNKQLALESFLEVCCWGNLNEVRDHLIQGM